jgi:SNF2 family DNA or RNA helicase
VPEAVRAELMRHAPPEGECPERLKGHPDAPSPDRVVPPGDGPLPPRGDTVQPAPEPPDERRKAFWDRVATAALDPVGGDQVGEATCAIRPWPHQVRAFHRMYDNWPPKLLIADEVGLGKTIQAGLLLRQAWLAGRVKRVLVLAPASVCRQWQIELREKFNLDWPLHDGRQFTWATSHARKEPVERQVSRSDWHREPFVIMSSHLARRHDRQAELLEAAEPWDLVVLDEAHHARRKGAGSVSEEGPNQLLRLMLKLRNRTKGLVLLTATPMQVAPVELWDLLHLLGLPNAWHKDAFERFFSDLSSPDVTNDKLDRLSALFRESEAAFGPISRAEAERLTGLSRLRSKKVLEALRDGSRIPRRQLNHEQRKAALKLIRQASPVKALVSRHTRELLRRYHNAGKLSTPIATRHVEDRFIELSPSYAGNWVMGPDKAAYRGG